jgi:chitin synthase
MITSFLQYTLMAPSYINVLNVYAFANVHDISWGTKGDNVAAKDLGTVTTAPGKKNANEVEAEVPTDEKDIDELYQDAMHVLQSKKPKEVKKVNLSQKQDDYYANFRTKFVISFHSLS